MDHLLQEFFDEDASYRKLRKADQQQLFNEWAKRRGIEAELELSDHQWVKILRWGAVTIGVAYLISLFPGIQTLDRSVVPVVMGLVVLVQCCEKRRLKIIKQKP